MPRYIHTAPLLLALGLATLLAGCAQGQAALEPGPAPTPSISPLFSLPAHPTPTLGPLFPAATSAPTRERPTAPTPASVADASGLRVVPVFDEGLRPGWELAAGSQGVRTDAGRSGYAHSGSTAIAVRTLGDEGQAQISLVAGARSVFPRERVMGISFWVSGGDRPIAPEDLAVAVIGSNRLTYWDPDDKSVQLEGRITDDAAPLFSETRLYYLDIQRAIPAYTWVEVVLWLDNQIYDPEYRYLTGFYVKNDELFQGAYYIDDVNLLLLE